MTDPPIRPRRGGHRTGPAGAWEDLRRTWTAAYRRTSIDHKRFVLLVFLIGVALRLSRMLDPVTYNEAALWADHAHRSFGSLFTALPLPNNSILLSILVKVATTVFGVHPWSLRLTSLLAGILTMPLFYAFVRATFNRYIAVLALCLVATSGPLVEYSAMTRGFALTWPLIMGALLCARHFIKREDPYSLVLMALCCALGLWATPSMVHAVVMVYAWTFLMIAMTYRSTVRRRSFKVLGSLVLLVLLTLLCYSPVIATHSLEQTIYDPSMMDTTWKLFMASQQDRAFDLWAYITGTAPAVVSALGIAAVTHAAYTSGKYRLLLFSLVIGTVPIVLLERMVAVPATWIFILLVLHIGSAIGLFYLLKFIRDKFRPSLEKPRRTLVASLCILACFSWWTITGERVNVERFPDAATIAHWFAAKAAPGDRIQAEYPWDAPLLFNLACAHADPRAMDGPAVDEARTYLVVGVADRQTALGVWRSVMTERADHAQLLRVLRLQHAEVFVRIP